MADEPHVKSDTNGGLPWWREAKGVTAVAGAIALLLTAALTGSGAFVTYLTSAENVKLEVEKQRLNLALEEEKLETTRKDSLDKLQHRYLELAVRPDLTSEQQVRIFTLLEVLLAGEMKEYATSELKRAKAERDHDDELEVKLDDAIKKDSRKEAAVLQRRIAAKAMTHEDAWDCEAGCLTGWTDEKLKEDEYLSCLAACRTTGRRP